MNSVPECSCLTSKYMGGQWVSCCSDLEGETRYFAANGRCWRCGDALLLPGTYVPTTTMPRLVLRNETLQLVADPEAPRPDDWIVGGVAVAPSAQEAFAAAQACVSQPGPSAETDIEWRDGRLTASVTLCTDGKTWYWLVADIMQASVKGEGYERKHSDAEAAARAIIAAEKGADHAE